MSSGANFTMGGNENERIQPPFGIRRTYFALVEVYGERRLPSGEYSVVVQSEFLAHRMAPPFAALALPIDITPMTNPSLKSLAWACKVLAIISSIVVPLILHPRWGVNRIADV